MASIYIYIYIYTMVDHDNRCKGYHRNTPYLFHNAVRHIMYKLCNTDIC